MSEQLVDERTLLATAAAPFVRSGMKVESELPGILVVRASQIKIPVGFMLFLTLITVGFWIPVWILLVCLPRVNRRTFTIEDGVVVSKSSWRNA